MKWIYITFKYISITKKKKNYPQNIQISECDILFKSCIKVFYPLKVKQRRKYRVLKDGKLRSTSIILLLKCIENYSLQKAE